MKQMHGWLVFFVMAVFALSPVLSADAEVSGKFLIKQSSEQIEELEEENEELQEITLNLVTFAEKITLNGFVELNYDYVDVSDTANENSDGNSDLYLSSVELALRIFFNKLAKAKIVANAEDVGRQDGDANISLDEAIVTLKSPRIPLYFIGGKTTLPFGVFEDPMISGTITEDLYEIDDVGVTLGLAPDVYGLNISVTVYEGQNIIENLEDFGTHEFSPGRMKEEDVDSFIANVTLEPLEEILSLAVFYNSEPGDGNRNRSMGGALTLNVWKFVFDTEYITALEREKGGDGKENKDNAWFVALAFQPSEKLELATRYEVFNDDRSGDQDEIPGDRYLAGFNYSFFNFATLSFEYRHSRFEKESGSNAADEQNEFRFQLALKF
ncbi:MAG: LbtU family siderophore porin [Planctomycetota bacterium]